MVMSILQIRKEKFRELNNWSQMTPLVSPGEVLAQVIWLTVLLSLLSVQPRAQVPLDVSCFHLQEIVFLQVHSELGQRTER